MKRLSVTVIVGLAVVLILAAFPRMNPSFAASSILSKQATPITLKQPSDFHAFADVNGQMFGAGANTIAMIDQAGRVTRSFSTAIARVSISPHGSTALMVGDLVRKAVSTLDIKTGTLRPLLNLNEVRDPSSDKAPGGHLLRDGAFSSVASDGRQIFVAVEAGFSSSIFKIDPATRQIIARAWASADDPRAMVFQNGGLFVLVGNGSQVRRFNDSLQRSKDNIELPLSGTKGIGIRSGEILTLYKGQVLKVVVPPAELTIQGIIKNLDRTSFIPMKIREKIRPINLPQRFALLITGDLAENFWGECFWNDTVWMYKTLLANGYALENIFVLYGDGNDYISANPAYRHPSRVTDYAATIGNVNIVLDGLKNGDAARGIPKMDANDSLFVWTFDHGDRSGTESTLCLRDGQMGANAFAAKLNAITYGARAVFMQQCYGGGFIDPLKNTKTFISTACRANEIAQRADTENEVVGSKTYSHGEYNYWIISALNRLTPVGAAVNADANADTFIAMGEMHSWNVGHESRAETPQSNDMGAIGSSFRMKKTLPTPIPQPAAIREPKRQPAALPLPGPLPEPRRR
jgi:hypothetical protein